MRGVTETGCPELQTMIAGGTRAWGAPCAALLLLAGCAAPDAREGDDRAAPDFDDPAPLRAQGNEPGWHAEIERDGLRLELDYGASAHTIGHDGGEPAGGAWRYRGEADGKRVALDVHDELCVDDMSGMPYPYTVALAFGERSLAGCGGDPAALLSAHEWQVVTVDGDAVAGEAAVTLAFADDGQLHGQGPCSPYSGQWRLTGESLTLHHLEAGGATCTAAQRRAQEQLLGRLAETTRFEAPDAQALILHGPEGRVRAEAR